MTATRTTTRSWLAGQTRLGRRAARPVVGFVMAGTALAIVQAWLLGQSLASLLARQSLHWPVFAALGAVAIARAGCFYLAEMQAAAAGAAARRRLRSESLTRLLEIGPSLLRTQHSAALTAIVVDRIEALDGFFARWLPAATLAVAAPLLIAVAVALVNPLDALVLAACGALVPVAMALSGVGAAAASRRQFLALERLQVRFLDRVRGIATIVLLGRGEAEAAAIGVAAEELRVRTMRILRMAFLSSAALDCAAAVAIIVIALRAAALFGSGEAVAPLAAGHALMALLLAPEFFAPLRAFSAAYQDRAHATAAAEAIADLPAPPPAAAPSIVRNVQAQGLSIAFENVSLRWDAARPPSLDGVSFRVAAGETLVLAGPSGAGKSSVIEILLGFVRPTAGRVTLNGADIATLVPQALSRLTAWIGQRPMIFAASVEDNIRFARPEASDAELAAAVGFARLDGVLAALPDGLQTMLGEGGYGLSGGQAQRVAIARAFLKNAPLLLLDEPTSHLDPATEQEVLDSLRRLAIGRTVVLASHAAAAHAFAGRRIDLRDGRVAPPSRAGAA